MINNLIIQSANSEIKIGPGNPVFIVAEISANHNQSIDLAKGLIDAAAQAGANAVKMQTYTADTITIDSDKEYFKITGGNWAGETLYSLYQKAYTPWEWQAELKTYAEGKDLVWFSAPFDQTAVSFLEGLGVSLYKIAGYEFADLPLLQAVAKTGKPVVASAAMASVEDIAWSIKILRDNGCSHLAILHCINAYPANPEEMNISTITDIINRFGVVSGLSDHSLGAEAAVAAVAAGASIIEKHIIISRQSDSPDKEFSLEPDEFKSLVNAVRETEKIIGRPKYGAGLSEQPNEKFKRSLFVVKDIKRGETFTEENVRSIRPGYGLPPKFLPKIMGKKAVQDIERGTPLSNDLID
ncbi:MAG: pseudaminic acid synthase [Patescibacteria group bacterium]|jgi:pseudaminic acid synthase|nr:pseudaminic acid synthase [Patescibacteria group bacterium]